MRKKRGGLEKYRARYGYMFIAPWIVGLVLFFLIPIGQSFIYAFSDVKFVGNSLTSSLVGLKNFDYIINEHPKYLNYLMESLTTIAFSMPAIVIISLVIALILNTKFKGRTFFRGLYFLPVIIASGVVIELLFAVNSDDIVSAGMNEAVSNNMIDFSSVILKLGIPGKMADYLSMVLGNIFDIVWNCGIQIVLFISGMQSIPDQLYEVAKVEGCTKWEEFWFITLPMLSRTLMLVLVFTIVELLTTKTNVLMELVLTTINNLEYGVGAAMAWFYFIIIGFVLAAAMFLLDRVWIRRWKEDDFAK